MSSVTKSLGTSSSLADSELPWPPRRACACAEAPADRRGIAVKPNSLPAEGRCEQGFGHVLEGGWVLAHGLGAHGLGLELFGHVLQGAAEALHGCEIELRRAKLAGYALERKLVGLHGGQAEIGRAPVLRDQAQEAFVPDSRQAELRGQQGAWHEAQGVALAATASWHKSAILSASGTRRSAQPEPRTVARQSSGMRREGGTCSRLHQSSATLERYSCSVIMVSCFLERRGTVPCTRGAGTRSGAGERRK